MQANRNAPRAHLRLVGEDALTEIDRILGPTDDIGEALLGEVLALVEKRLPDLSPDDPTRPAFVSIVTSLGDALGRGRRLQIVR